MKNFEMTKKMIRLGGAFYPTGYAFIMFPDIEDARQAARELELSEETVKTHTKHILARLNARNRTHAVAIALRSSLIE